LFAATARMRMMLKEGIKGFSAQSFTQAGYVWSPFVKEFCIDFSYNTIKGFGIRFSALKTS
jgi:hypothetical protein